MINIDTEIKEKFDLVVKYSQSFLFENDSSINTQPIFDLWSVNKEQLYHLMGDKLIYETDEIIEFKLDEHNCVREKNRFINNLYTQFDYEDLFRFVDVQSVESFYNNRVGSSYEYGNIKIPKDMKLSKAFKYFVTDEETLRVIQDVYSEVIQRNKVSGKLCISIHPLDYLSTSETTHNWRSCHALDGEYRAGGLSYMCDKTTVVCYIKSDKEAKLPHFPASVMWNDKKWRMLVHLEEESQRVMIAGRQYPFEVSGAREKIKDIIDEMKVQRYNYRPPYSDHHFVDWTDEHFASFKSSELSNPDETKYTTKPYRYINGLITPMGAFVKTPKKQILHYNDVMQSHIYPWPHITWESNRSFSVVPKVRIGYDGVPCVCCGENPIAHSETFACSSCDCENQNYCCDYCGSSVSEEELYYIDDEDSYICPRCYHEHFITCPACGYATLRDQVVYSEQRHELVCPACHDLFLNNELASVTTSTESAPSINLWGDWESVVTTNEPVINLTQNHDFTFTLSDATINLGALTGERYTF